VHGDRGGESFGYAARLSGVNACEELEDFDEVHSLVDTSLEGCCDMFVHKGCPSLGCDDVIPIPLSIPIFLPCFQTLHFPLSILLMCPMIFLNFVILIWIWAVMIACLMCLVGMMKIFSP